ncbi:MFS transporter [Erythrobacter sp. Dej080120_24]|uniref:MFS transporter n=1 Tax=Erythrobacter sp. Dej080120_24 TaxID=3024837 RepID=UPI002924DD0C|nr:MFS transporter [Erythrobacter sp. Dej080120_24]
MQASAVSEPAPVLQTGKVSPYAWFVLGVLCLGSIVSYIDRQIINLLVEPIKLDLGINDTQIGLLQGFSFVLFYAILALPLARLADSSNRVRVIMYGVLCWSFATFFCGLAASFAVLFIARMLVGVGEATLTPSAYSIIPDYFPKDRAAMAISIFAGSTFIGSGVAYIIGGRIIGYLESVGSISLPLVGLLAPWQLTFIFVAIPGLLVFLLMLAVREPARIDAGVGQDDARIAAVVGHLKTNPRLFTGLFFGLTLLAAGTFAVNSWAPTFFIRVYGWSPGEVGAVFGTLVVVASAGGVFAGGAIASALMRRGVASANMLVPMVAAGLAIPLSIAFPLMPSATSSLMVLAPMLFLSAVPFGCGSAVLPLVSPNRMRAQMVALYLLVANLVGFTLGPTSIGVLTDFVYRSPDLIGWALATSPPLFYLIGLGLIGWAIPPYRELIESRA